MMRKKYELKQESQRVNTMLRDDAVKLKLGTKISMQRLDAARGNSTAFSKWAELEFREFVRRQIEHTAGSATALCDAGAAMLSLSPETTRRYLQKMRTPGAAFSGLGDIVVLNPNWMPPELNPYFLDVDDSAANGEDKD